MKRLATEKRQEQIIKASLAIIRNGGLSRLTIKELSKRVQISEQAIYRHFENKLAILQELILYFTRSLSEKTSQIEPQDDIIANLHRTIMAHLEFFAEHPEMAVLVYPEEVFQAEPVVSEIIQKTINKRIITITKMIAAGQEQGNIVSFPSPENLTIILFGSIRMLITRWRFSDFSFDLLAQGELLTKDILGLISTNDQNSV